MTRHPHDVSDLYLAPVLLAVDARLDELGALSPAELGQRVAVESDQPARTREMREAGLLFTVSYFLDLHGWTLSWHPRGLRVAHGLNGVVLGVPTVFNAYVEGEVGAGRTGVTSMR